jgi:Molybdate transporter of MFS superfamily
MTPETIAPQETTNRFDRMEIAGAFGDLGTLIPFVVAYLAVLKMDPFGVLFAFGTGMLVCGFVFRTPIPVQPMKAAGARSLPPRQRRRSPSHRQWFTVRAW